MAELTGIPTEGFFRSTASVRHFELSDLSRDEGALRDRLQASISGADRGTSRARKKLDRALHDLSTRGDRNPGRLKVAEQAVEQAQAALEQGEHGPRPARTRSRHDGRAPATGGPRRRPILAERRSMLEKARQAERLAAERDAATERYERYRQAVDVDAEIARPRDQRIRRPTRCRRPPWRRRATARARRDDPRAAGGPVGRGRRSSSRSPPEPTWRPLSRISVVLVVARDPAGRRPGRPRVPRHRRPRRRSSRSSAAIIAVVGLVLAAVALWLRRSVKHAGPAARRRDRPAPARPVGHGGRARRCRAADDGAARLARPARPRRGRGPARPRGGARRPDRPARPPSSTGSSARNRRATLADHARHRRARDRAEDERARGARADRQGAARPRAARGRGPRPGEAPSSAPATTRPTPAPGSRRTPSTPSRSPARPSGWPPGASSSPRPSAASASSTSRSQAHRPRRAGDDEDGDALPRGAHGRATSRRSPAAAIAASGSTTRRSTSRSTRPRRATGSRSRRSARARSTSSTWSPGSGSSGWSPATGGRRSSSTIRS